jgi:hypothetical protein
MSVLIITEKFELRCLLKLYIKNCEVTFTLTTVYFVLFIFYKLNLKSLISLKDFYLFKSQSEIFYKYTSLILINKQF